ncbi:hypothetical protein GJ744_007528 [Endocarpon pusillum]|uniref:N-acetyltransferase domain-containing protein n=1 Tax=Endocarpon pusillum TaxID=364733 RepID=A0A8H7AKJ6_9EURO|nr:hypothetical protein GJ744_007528 [Endocarpon pusillum]
MLINEYTAISTSKVLLVPYSEHHVPQYHEWMQDRAIQEATASEPLTLTQEYAMQESWQKDSDKLTFIICQPSPNQADQKLLSHVEPKTHDNADRMIGDVNLFLSFSSEVDTNPEHQHANEYTVQPPSNLSGDECQSATTTVEVTGELELMVAVPTCQRKGYGRAALLTFIRYVLMHRSEIIAEFLQANPPSKLPSTHHRDRIHETARTPTTTRTGSSAELSLTAKISTTNTASLSLFQSLGFIKTAEEPNYFGEWELRLPAAMCGDGPDSQTEWERKLERWEVTAWREMRYG